MTEGNTFDDQDGSDDEVYESDVGKIKEDEFLSCGENINLIRDTSH